MMILSVGGSAEPVINAIKKGKADYYYFFVPLVRKAASS